MAASKKPRPVLHVAGSRSAGSVEVPGELPKKEASQPVDRNTLVALAAYYRAEKRNFFPGGELDDWLAAEREVDAALAATGRQMAAGGS